MRFNNPTSTKNETLFPQGKPRTFRVRSHNFEVMAMKKQSACRSSFFIPRAVLGLVLLLFGLSIGLLAQGPNTPAAFTPSNNMPPARAGMGMAYDAAQEQVVLFGGVDCSLGNEFNDTWVWDGTTWTQVFPASSPSARESDMTYD